MLFQILAVIVLAHGVTHHPDQLGAETLHPRDRPADLSLSDSEIIGDLFGPVANERSKATHLHALFLKMGHDLVEHTVRDLMQIALHSVEFHASRFDAVPAKVLVGLNLHVEGCACFVCNTGKFDHEIKKWEVLPLARGRRGQVRMPR